MPVKSHAAWMASISYCGFDGAQFVHQRREAMIAVQRKLPLAVPDKARIARFHRHVGALVLVAVEIDIFQLADELTGKSPEIPKAISHS